MNMEIVAWVFIYFSIGWLFTIWFVNDFLIDRRFSDADKEVGPGMMIMLHLVGPMMLAVIILFVTIEFILKNTGDWIRRFYGVRK